MFNLFAPRLHFTAFWLTYFLHILLNIASDTMKYRNSYPINMFYK